MYQPKNIVYIQDYDFENGEPLKNRYIIVLENDGNSALVISFVTSQDHIPSHMFEHGCVREDERNIHCYIYDQNKTIGENGFKFPLNSFVYMNTKAVIDMDSNKLDLNYSGKIEVKDVLVDSEFEELIYCIYKSKFLPRKIKRKLETTLERICN